jgi:hypothetical protein
VFRIGMETTLSQRGMDAIAVGEQQGIANIKKDDFHFRIHRQGTFFGFECKPLAWLPLDRLP